MKNKKVLVGVLGAVLIVTVGLVAYTLTRRENREPVVSNTETEDEFIEELSPVSDSVTVTVQPSSTKDNAVEIVVSGMAGNYREVEYELTYESEGIFQGVNSGSKPIDTSGQDGFEREVYLGTCSKNVCRPHPGVEQVTLTMIFTGSDGQKSQFEQDYPLN